MKKWLISAAALALAVTLVGQQPLSHAQDGEPGITGEVTPQGYLVRDFAPNKPVGPTIYGDDGVIPRVYVRFDDNRAGADPNNPVKSQVAAFLRRGLPAALSINANNIGTSTYMTWDDVRQLQDLARSKGTTLHIIQHTNGNFATPFLLTHDEIVAELETSEIERETGYRPRFLAIPGDAGRREFWKRNRGYMQGVTDSLGLWYTDYNTGMLQSTGDSTFTLRFEPSVIDLDNYAAQRANFKTLDMGWMKPGQGNLRTELLSSTLDLGQMVVERAASDLAENFALTTSLNLGDRGTRYGFEFETGVKPPRNNAWFLTANGATANATGAYRKTWASVYSAALATNRGFAVVLHDSAFAATSSLSGVGISDAEYRAGAVGIDHIAWTLAMLQSKGHIKVVGPEEWAEWVTGDFAPGTELIQNPRCLIPQFDIGDTLGATSEYAIIRGLGTNGVNITNQSAASQIGNLPTEQTGNVAKWLRRTGSSSADSPYYAIGDSVTGVRGRKGGIQLFADGSNPSRLRLAWGDLKPGGRYLFSADMYTPSTVNPILEEYHLAWMGKFYKIADSVAAGFAPAFRDTAISWQWRDADTTINPPAFADAKWQSLDLPFYVPAMPTGETVAGANYGSVNEATGTRLFKPLATNASQGILIDGKWAWSLIINGQGATKLSNPRLIYLGQMGGQ